MADIGECFLKSEFNQSKFNLKQNVTMAQEEKHPVKTLKDFRLGNRILEKNHVCCDCDAPDPKWAVTSHGVLVWYVKHNYLTTQ